MEELTTRDLIGWKANRRIGPAIVKTATLNGTANQIEWAEQIKERVGYEFDRVANAMRSVAAKQEKLDRADTLDLVAILEEKRLEVMANNRAGYFIHDWQELSDQVRQMVVADPRCADIMMRQAARRRVTPGLPPDFIQS